MWIILLCQLEMKWVRHFLGSKGDSVIRAIVYPAPISANPMIASRIFVLGSLSADLPDIPSVNVTRQRPHNAPNFDFFNYAGINRPVKIYTTPERYIEDIVLVPRIREKDAVVSYKVKYTGSEELRITIYDESGCAVAEGTGQEGELIIKDAHLWWPGNAYLYTAEIISGDDTYRETFGVRSVEIKGTQFLINGKSFYFKGFGKHEDTEVHGRGLDEAYNVKDISLMKWLHANSFRSSHYPYAEEMLNLCDREGIVVIDETPAVGLNFGWDDEGYKKFRTKEHHQDVIRDLIARDKNHPCVVVWSIANEPDTEKQPQEAYDYFYPLYELAHACDPQDRPVSLVCCQNDYTRDLVAPAMDIVMVNRYYGWYIFGGFRSRQRSYEYRDAILGEDWKALDDYGIWCGHCCRTSSCYAEYVYGRIPGRLL